MYDWRNIVYKKTRPEKGLVSNKYMLIFFAKLPSITHFT